MLAIAKIPEAGVTLLYCVGLAGALFAIPRLIANKRFRLLTLLALAASAVTVADVMYRGQPPILALDASAPRILVYCSAIAIFVLVFGLSRMDLLVCSAIAVAMLWPQVAQTEDLATSWKYAFFIPISILLLVLFDTGSARSRRLGYLALLALGVASVLATLRSGAIEVIVVGAIALIHGSKAIALRFKRPTTIAAGVVLIALGVFVLPSFAIAGTFGNSIQKSFMSDSASSSDSVLGGRSELPMSLATAVESPIFGQGSMPIATSGTLTRAADIANTLGVNPGPSVLRTWYNPWTLVTSAHSIIMEMWIMSGLVGLLTGILCAFILIRAIFTNLSANVKVNFGWLFLMVSLVWDLMFSPMLNGRDLLLCVGLFTALNHLAPANLASRSQDESALSRRSSQS